MTAITHRSPHMPGWLLGVLAATITLLALGIGVLIGRDSTTSDTIKGSGSSTTEVRAVEPFTGVELAGANSMTVNVGSAQTVSVTADDNLIDRVTTTVEEGTLVIDDNGNYSTRSRMSVAVTVPSLTSLSLSGAGELTVTGVDAEEFTVSLDGAGKLTVSGTTDALRVTMRGTGYADLQSLSARDVTAQLPGTGLIQVHANESLDASVAGSGTIRYTGNPPKVTQKVTGTGAIVAF